MSAAFTVREGHVSMRLWPAPSRKKGKLYSAWEFEYSDPELGRRRVKRATRAKAEAEARTIAQRLSAGELLVKGREAAEYAEVNLIAARWGVTVSEIGRDYHTRRQALAAQPAAHKTTAEIIGEMLALKRQRGRSALHLRDLNLRLTHFARDVTCPLQDLTAGMLEAWLSSLKLGLRSQRNYLGAVSNLVHFAKQKKYLPKTHSAVDDVEPVQLPEKDIGEKIFTPRELELILKHISPRGLPVVLLNAFAGLRVSDVFRLDWNDINWEDNLIRVSALTKTGRRVPPLLPNLRAWLEPLREKGPVASMTSNAWGSMIGRLERNINFALRREHSREKFKWKRNAPRHCYASYRLAQTQNLDQVALECGHSAAMLRKNYRDLVTPAAAKEWFNLLPKAGVNVIQLSLFDRQERPTDREFSPELPPKAERSSVFS